jgi:hypothetical protein
VDGACEHGNKPSVSIKFWEILEYLHNWLLLKKGSGPWDMNKVNVFYVAIAVICVIVTVCSSYE